MPESGRSALTEAAVTATVAVDARRCELHGQCGGLSGRLLPRPGGRDRLVVGGDLADVASMEVLERQVRSCPMHALTLIAVEPDGPSHKEN